MVSDYIRQGQLHLVVAWRFWKTSQFDKLFPIIDAHRSFEDWPWPLMYQMLYEKYPNSKFILSTRSSTEKWYSSLAKHAIRTGPTEFRKLIYGYAMPQENEIFHKEFYEQHNREVIEFFQQNDPQKLLVVCWEHGDQWEEICRFLEKDIPKIPFPHLNHQQFSWNEKMKRKIKRGIKLIIKGK